MVGRGLDLAARRRGQVEDGLDAVVYHLGDGAGPQGQVFNVAGDDAVQFGRAGVQILDADHAAAGRVHDLGVTWQTFVEAIASEELDVGVDIRGSVLGDASGRTALHEDILVPLDLRRFFLADSPAHQVGLAGSVAGEFTQDLNDLLLIDYNAVCFGQNRFQRFVLVFYRFIPVHAADENRNIVDRPRPIQRNGGDDVLEHGGAHLGEDPAHALGLDLEDAADFAAGEEVEGPASRFAFEGHVVQLVFDAVALPDQPPGLPHDREGAEAQKVDLEQADGLQNGELVLGDGLGDGGLAAPHEGGVVGEFPVRHDDRGGVDARVPGHPLQLHGGLQQFLDPFFLLEQVDQLGAVELVALGQHILDGDGLAGDAGDQLGDAVHLVQGDVLDPAHVSDGGPGLHAPKGDDLGHLVRAVLFDGIADQLLPLIVRVVQVEVGHGDPTRVEEALEDQVVLQGVQSGDADAIGHDGACARSTHVPPDVAAAGKVAQVGHDQEVDGKAHLVDDAQLLLHAGLHLLVHGPLAVALGQPLHGQVAQIGGIGVALGDGHVGQVILFVLQIHLAHLGDAQGVVVGAGRQVDEGAEGLLKLFAALHKVAGIAEPHTLFVGEVGAGLDAEQHVVGAAVFLFDVMNIVGDHHLQAKLVGPGYQDLVHPHQFGDIVFLDLDEKILFAKEIHIPAQAVVGLFFLALFQKLGHLRAQTASGGDQSLGVLFQKIVVDTGFVIEAVGVAVGRNLEQVAIAGHVAGQHQEMVVLLVELAVPAAHGPPPHGLIRLQTDDGLDLRLLGRPEELHRAVHGPVIRDGQGRMAQPLGLGHQILDPAQAVKQGIF